MILYLTCTDQSDVFVNINRDLFLRARNDEGLTLYFINEIDDAVNITGATIYFVVKNKATDSDSNAVLNKTITSISFPNALSGEALITLTKTETNSLLGNYLYSISIKLADNTIRTVSEGIIAFSRDLKSSY